RHAGQRSDGGGQHAPWRPRGAGGRAGAGGGVRLAGARPLADLDPDTAPALPALVEALRQPDAGVRLPLLRAVGSLGPKGSPAVPVLVRLGEDEGPAVRREAAAALGVGGGGGGGAPRPP